MANLAIDQITIVDVTDAYAVMLSNDSFVFPGSVTTALAGNTTTKVSAMIGASAVACSVVVADIIKPANVTVTSDDDPTAPTLTIAVTTAVTSGGIVKIPVTIGDVTIMKEFSFSIAFTGATGTAGKGVASSVVSYQINNDGTTAPTGTWQTTPQATTLSNPYLWTRLVITYTDATTVTTYSVSKYGDTGATGPSSTFVDIGNDAVAIPCTSAGATSAASTITIPFTAYTGTSKVAVSVVASTLPTGITVQTNTAAVAGGSGSLVLAVANASTLGGAVSGEITLTFTITVGGQQFVRVFSWSKALQGAGGGTGASATSVDVGNEATVIPCDNSGATLAASTITIPFTGWVGSTRAAATITATNLPTGITAGTNTAGTSGAAGSLILNVASGATLGGASLGTIDLAIVCNSLTFNRKFSWSKSLTGAAGAAGADAISISVTSSNGFIFKNTAIATSLTANVYKGGTLLTAPQVAALGVVKWYKDGVYLTGKDGLTLVISSGDVASKADYTAQLEG